MAIDAELPWIDGIKRYKRDICAGNPSDPDLLPLVIAERAGGLVIGVVAPCCDKREMLRAAQVVRGCVRLDALTLVSDGFCLAQELPPGADPDAAALRAGDLAARWQRGERAGISECLLVLRWEVPDRLVHAALPYRFEAPELAWNDRDAQHFITPAAGAGEGGELRGYLPEALRAIMALPPLREHELLRGAAAELGMSPEKQEHHTLRAACRVLEGYGFGVLAPGALSLKSPPPG